jgi:hypothetical protein
LFTTTTGTQYYGINGYVGNDHTSYLVKLGGVTLTGGAGKGYTIGNQGDPNVGKVILSEAPTAGYELEVRAIQVGAAATTLQGTLVSPVRELVDVQSSGITGTVNLDLETKQVYLYNTAATGNFTLNLRGGASSTLDSMLSNAGTSVAVTVLVNMGASLYNLSAVKVDGVTVTVKWQNSSNTMTADKMNIISLLVVKTGTGAYTVIGSVSAAGTV